MRNRHKTCRRWAIPLLLAGLAAPQPLVAQAAPADIPSVRPGDVVAVLVGSAIAAAPRVFGWGPARASCAPCDPTRLPAIDRWTVHAPRPAWGVASWIVLGGLTVAAVADVGGHDGGSPYLTGMAESLVWTTAATEVLKAGVGRPRPVLYTELAGAAADARDNMRSFPSGHASAAFAVATSYWLARRDLAGGAGAAAWTAAGAAATVAVLRVVAGKHFPTDVLAGAVLGIATGALVHTIKY